MLGSGAMTNSIADIPQAATIFVICSNTTEAPPVIGVRVKKAARDGAKLIVASPRRFRLCNFADVWLQHRPGSDVAMLMGMARVIVDEGLLDGDFIAQQCEGFEEFCRSLEAFDLETAERLTGVSGDSIARAARLYASNGPASILYCMGVTRSSHGTENVQALASLALLTGNIGKPGSGVNPLRRQNNAQGACDVGCLPNVYPGYQRTSDPSVRRKFEEAWNVPLPRIPGLTLGEMFRAMRAGLIRAAYLVGENPVLSDADGARVREALQELDFLVVQDIFLTETAQLADVVLPVVSFAEKDGTFTSTERRVQRVRKAVVPIGESRPDWWITCQLARRLNGRGFDFANAEQIFNELRDLAPAYGGITYARLEVSGLQWPCPTEDHPGMPILHVGRVARGKGRFVTLTYRPPAEEPDRTTRSCLPRGGPCSTTTWAA